MYESLSDFFFFKPTTFGVMITLAVHRAAGKVEPVSGLWLRLVCVRNPPQVKVDTDCF